MTHFEPELIASRVHLGLRVFDRNGVAVGWVMHVHRPDPMAIADDGRRIGVTNDIAALLPGFHLRTLPTVPIPVAAVLTREGYIEINAGKRLHERLAALTVVEDVDEFGVYLSVAADDLPSS